MLLGKQTILHRVISNICAINVTRTTNTTLTMGNLLHLYRKVDFEPRHLDR